ncbi:MAG: hypothetical protein WBG70_08670 [Spirulinaceae cyanobacterium]
MSISEGIFPVGGTLVFLTLGLVGVLLPSIKTLQIDKTANKLTIKTEKFLPIKMQEYSLDEVSVGIKKIFYGTPKRPLWKVVLNTDSDSRQINLFSSVSNRDGAIEITELIRSFLNKSSE